MSRVTLDPSKSFPSHLQWRPRPAEANHLPRISFMSSNTLLATIHSSSHTGFLDIPKNIRQSLLWPFHDLFLQVTQGSFPCLLHSFAQMSFCQETFSDSPFKTHTGIPALLIALPIFVFLHRTYHLLKCYKMCLFIIYLLPQCKLHELRVGFLFVLCTYVSSTHKTLPGMW